MLDLNQVMIILRSTTRIVDEKHLVFFAKKTVKCIELVNMSVKKNTNHHLRMNIDQEPPGLLSPAVVRMWLWVLLRFEFTTLLYLPIP